MKWLWLFVITLINAAEKEDKRVPEDVIRGYTDLIPIPGEVLLVVGEDDTSAGACYVCCSAHTDISCCQYCGAELYYGRK